jgi:6-phosphogluconolactonase
MKLDVFPTPEAVAQKATTIIVKLAQERICSTGRFLFAMSGGTTPWKVLRQLADTTLMWEAIELFQVDERIAPAGDPQRNLTKINETLLNSISPRPVQVHAIPVEFASPKFVAEAYTQSLRERCGTPPILDLIHLGLGEDGHTASLLPDDPARKSLAPVTVSKQYQGLHRITMTYPTINAARQRLWIITGAHKRPMLERLYHGDSSIPAGLVERENSIILADKEAAGKL